MDNQQPSIIVEWREVIEYNHYEVNQFGEIRHKKFKRILKPRHNKAGYCYVNFRIDGKTKNFAVHQIVANAFIPNPNGYTEVNHKDYNRANNRVDNLEWVTSSENKTHAFQKEDNREARGKVVNQYDKQGNFIKSFPSISEAAKEVGCTIGAISNCCLGRSKTSMGYRWSYDEGSTTKYLRNSQ